jgi:mRNA-degrading endonuclease HigB of HigAB toxin-antitoxin module
MKTSMVKAFGKAHCQAEASLQTWVGQTRAARWRNFIELRKTFPNADQVTGQIGIATYKEQV